MSFAFEDSVFDAAFDGRADAADVVSCDPDDEEITNASVEEDLWRDARVGTSNDNGDGGLPSCESAGVRPAC